MRDLAFLAPFFAILAVFFLEETILVFSIARGVNAP